MRPDVTINELLAQKQPLLSVEFFPPKDDGGVTQFKKIAKALKEIAPDFVSVTYGAGGSTRQRTNQVSSILREDFNYTVMPHLTCVASTRNELLGTIKEFHRRGFRNIMVLRGDPPKGEKTFAPYKDGFRYASDLVTLIRKHYPDFCLGVAGYPEKHIEAPDMETDLAHLKNKVRQGAGFITTQLFFDNKFYFDFAKRCREIGIGVPILPGIMPVVSFKQVQRFTEMCGANLPPKLVTQLKAAGEDAEAVENVGIEWARGQIQELLAMGAPGIHLYVLNRSRAALALSQTLASEFSK